MYAGTSSGSSRSKGRLRLENGDPGLGRAVDPSDEAAVEPTDQPFLEIRSDGAASELRTICRPDW